jgi:hypothetical protein
MHFSYLVHELDMHINAEFILCLGGCQGRSRASGLVLSDDPLAEAFLL